MQNVRVCLVLVVVSAAAAPAPVLGEETEAVPATPAAIQGRVYVDENKNGAFDDGEPTLPGVKVFYETQTPVVTDDAGHYALTAPADGIVWARIPDGFEPSPSWQAVAVKNGAQTVDLGLRPMAAQGPLTFASTSDVHLENGIPQVDVQHALELAAQGEPAPRFLVVTGDISTDSSEATFDTLRGLIAALPVPFVPVIGNHDLYDGGGAYRKVLGPPEYCFEQGGVRFVVLSFTTFDNMPATLAFIDACGGDASEPLVLFAHMPIDDGTAGLLADHGVDYLFTGHWHSNRIVEHGLMEEVNTESLVMGGIDFTPAGYRVATFDGQRFSYAHRTVVDEPVLSVQWPPSEACVPAGPMTVVVAAESGATMGPVTVSLDGAVPAAMTEAGGWVRTAALDVAGTTHSLVVATSTGQTLTRPFCVTATRPAAPLAADWTQLQGSAAHLGATDHRVSPPLQHLWATPVGGHLLGGSVAVASGRVFVPVDDLADGSRGGVVALDAATGSTLWERRLGYAVHNTPAVVGDLVIAGTANGVVHALEAATGKDVWSDDLGAGMSQNYSWLYAAPSVADGVIYIGIERRFVAIDAASGRELWSVDPAPSSFWLGSYAAAGVSGGVVVVASSRGVDGLAAFDALDGTPLWTVPPPFSTAVNAGIVVDGDQAFVANSYTNVFALDLASPKAPDYATWQNRLHGDADDWSYGILGTPALASDRLFVPTMRGDVVALDRKSGAEIWRHTGAPGPLRPVHYRGSAVAAYAASPVVTADLVWVGGLDGRLSALDTETGKERFGMDLGAPIYEGPVPAGDLLFVGTFDGTVHALIHVPDASCPDAPGCTPAASGGGCVVATAPGPSAWPDGIWVIAAVLLGRRSASRRRRA